MKVQDQKKTISTLETFLGKGDKEKVSQVAKALSKLPKKERNIILEALEKELYKKENIGKIQVTGAMELGETEKKKIEHAVQHKYKFDHVVLEEKIDNRLIGGIKVKVGDEIYDGTLKSKIQKLSNILQK